MAHSNDRIECGVWCLDANDELGLGILHKSEVVLKDVEVIRRKRID